MEKKYRLFLLLFSLAALLISVLLLSLSSDVFLAFHDFHLSAVFSTRLLEGLSLLLSLSILAFLFFAFRNIRKKQ